MMEAAGFSACPADATPKAREAATLVLKNPGGHSAAREFIEWVLQLNGRSRGATSRKRRKSRRRPRSRFESSAPRL
jgi:3-deoxy-D-manno-octulosonate 8-phosphate phosphatase KdsC-like HAD superfamily phosphatase